CVCVFVCVYICATEGSDRIVWRFPAGPVPWSHPADLLAFSCAKGRPLKTQLRCRNVSMTYPLSERHIFIQRGKDRRGEEGQRERERGREGEKEEGREENAIERERMKKDTFLKLS